MDNKAAYTKSIYISAEVEIKGSEKTFTLMETLSLLEIPEDLINVEVKDFALRTLGEGLHRIIVIAEIGFDEIYQPITENGINLILSEVETFTPNN